MQHHPAEKMFRPHRYPAMIPLLVPLGVAAFLDAGHNTRHQQLLGLLTLVCILAAAYIYILRSRTMIRIDPSGISYRTLFTNRTIGWNELTNAKVKIHFNGRTKHLELAFYTNTNSNPLIISGFGFSRRSLQVIASAVLEAAPGMAVDNRFRKLSEGRFPRYFR
jgi:hypothetical protein